MKHTIIIPALLALAACTPAQICDQDVYHGDKADTAEEHCPKPVSWFGYSRGLTSTDGDHTWNKHVSIVSDNPPYERADREDVTDSNIAETPEPEAPSEPPAAAPETHPQADTRTKEEKQRLNRQRAEEREIRRARHAENVARRMMNQMRMPGAD